MFRKLKELFAPKKQDSFIITSDGNIVIALNGKSYAVGVTHLNYKKILDKLYWNDFVDLEDLIDAKVAINHQTDGLITVNSNGDVFFQNRMVHGVVVDRIVAFFRAGLSFGPLARFLENMMENPDPRAVDELYCFLEHGGFPLTPEGRFLAYKGVRADFKDKYTGTFDNSIGAEHRMLYSDVDNNKYAGCSRGFHVGTHEYARNWGDRVVMVEVNPRDAVSVPADHNFEKLRVCAYKVVAHCTGKIEEPLSGVSVSNNDFAKTGRRRGPGGRFLPSKKI